MPIAFVNIGIYNLKTIRFLDYVMHITPDIFVKHRRLDMTNFFNTFSPSTTMLTPILTRSFLTSEYDDYTNSLLEKSAGLLDSFRGKHEYAIMQRFGFNENGEAYLKIADDYFKIARMNDINKELFKNMFADIVEAFLEIRNLNAIYDEDFLEDKFNIAHKVLKWLIDEPMIKDEMLEVVGIPLNSFESVLMNEYIQEYDKYEGRSLYSKIAAESLETIRNKITKLLTRKYECLEK